MKLKKRLERLEHRIKKYQETMGSSNPFNDKINQRKSSGGYHKPGSMSK